MPVSLLQRGIERQAAANPTALAAVCGDESLSFAELNGQANCLARRLIAEGVEPGSLVAVWATRSIETLVNLLAVVKAGGAYLPLDPGYPVERLAFMIADGGASILLAPATSDIPLAIIAAGEREKPILLINPSSSAAAPHANDATDLEPLAGANDLAYVIFTSGSTGRPKGVMIEHVAAVNTLDDLNERFAVGPRDRVLCLSSFGFDLSVYDLFGVLGAGGAMVLPTEAESREPATWIDLMTRHRVTLWNSVPALMEMMVSYAETVDHCVMGSLRLVLLSGDWIPVSLPDRIRAHAPEAQVISLGGATEASIWSICFPVGQVAPDWSSIPYGRALRNQSMHVLDAALRPCPTGTTGELYIGGVGVARGYLNRPELTSERFLADPFSSDPNARLYRTGDMARLLADGNIEFLGRVDNQVKINGNRVELGEIEAWLARHPQIRDAAVVAPRDVGGRRRLIAFCVPATSIPASETELREGLARALPAYMIPARFVSLAALPLSSNGKVDRALLTAMPLTSQHPSGGFAPPRNDFERRLAEIWKIVFELPSIDIHDDFFELGGDSLFAVSLLSRVNREFGSSLHLTDLIQHPTVAELASLLGAGTQRDTSQAVEIQSGGSRPPLFFAPCMHGNLMTIRALAARLDSEQPVFGLQPIGVDGRGVPHDSVPQLAEHYLRQIRAVQPCGPYYLMGYSMGGTIAFEMAQRLTAENGTVGLLILVDAPFRSRPWVVRQGQQTVVQLSANVLGMLRTLTRAAPPENDPPLLQARMMAAHFQALVAYRARPYRGATALFRAKDRSHAVKRLVDGLAQDWKRQGLVARDTPVLWSPGAHETMFSQPNVDVLAGLVQRQLDAAFSMPSGPLPVR